MNRRELFRGALGLLVTAAVAPKELFARGGIVPPGPPYLVGMNPCEFKLTPEQAAAFDELRPPDHPNCHCVIEHRPGFTWANWTVSEGRFNLSTTYPEFACLEAGDLVEIGDGVMGEVESITIDPVIRLSVKIVSVPRTPALSVFRTLVNTSAGQFNE